jgi:hypothetical protein
VPGEHLGHQPGKPSPVVVGWVRFAQRRDEGEPVVAAGEALQFAEEKEVATASGTVEEDDVTAVSRGGEVLEHGEDGAIPDPPATMIMGLCDRRTPNWPNGPRSRS